MNGFFTTNWTLSEISYRLEKEIEKWYIPNPDKMFCRNYIDSLLDGYDIGEIFLRVLSTDPETGRVVYECVRGSARLSAIELFLKSKTEEVFQYPFASFTGQQRQLAFAKYVRVGIFSEDLTPIMIQKALNSLTLNG